MRTASRVLSGLMALAILLLSAAVVSAEPDGTGKIVGKVLKEGQPVASVKVVLTKPVPKDAPPGPDGKKPKPEVIAETQADADGGFAFADVPAGDYVVVAGDKEVGMGKVKASVKGGETTSVEVPVKTKPPRTDKPKEQGNAN